MTHLFVHLVEELELCIPMHAQWLYLVEHYLKKLKGYVRNRTKPKGSICQRLCFAHEIWWIL
jgi:hypothetical protein